MPTRLHIPIKPMFYALANAFSPPPTGASAPPCLDWVCARMLKAMFLVKTTRPSTWLLCLPCVAFACNTCKPCKSKPCPHQASRPVATKTFVYTVRSNSIKPTASGAPPGTIAAVPNLVHMPFHRAIKPWAIWLGNCIALTQALAPKHGEFANNAASSGRAKRRFLPLAYNVPYDIFVSI